MPKILSLVTDVSIDSRFHDSDLEIKRHVVRNWSSSMFQCCENSCRFCTIKNNGQWTLVPIRITLDQPFRRFTNWTSSCDAFATTITTATTTIVAKRTKTTNTSKNQLAPISFAKDGDEWDGRHRTVEKTSDNRDDGNQFEGTVAPRLIHGSRHESSEDSNHPHHVSSLWLTPFDSSPHFQPPRTRSPFSPGP